MPDKPTGCEARFCDKSLTRSARTRTLSSFVAPYRATALSPQCDTECPNIATGIEGSQRNRVLAGAQSGEVDRVNLVATVRNSVIGKHRDPGASIETRVRLFYLPGRVVSRKDDSHRVPIYLRRAHRFQHWRRVVDVNRFTQTFASQFLVRRVIWRVRRDDFDDVTSVGERRAVDRVEVFAQVIFQQPKRLIVQGAIVDRVLERIGIAIFSLPLKRTRAALVEPSRRDLRYWSKHGWIES